MNTKPFRNSDVKHGNQRRIVQVPDRAVVEYRAQIVRCAQALAVAKNDRIAPYLPAGASAEQVKMFTDGNLDKRFQKLRDEFEEMAEEFDEFEEAIADYVKHRPLVAYDTGASDAERFLDWLCRLHSLTAEQQDFVTCQRSRHAVEKLAEENRLGHVHFQELLSTTGQLAPELETNPGIWIHLNPIHVPAVFHTQALLDEEASAPADVVFFPVGNDVRTAVLEPEGAAVFGALKAFAPCRLGDTAFDSLRLERSEMIDICFDLSEIGLAAFG